MTGERRLLALRVRLEAAGLAGSGQGAWREYETRIRARLLRGPGG